jgi:hypothetical protein
MERNKNNEDQDEFEGWGWRSDHREGLMIDRKLRDNNETQNQN